MIIEVNSATEMKAFGKHLSGLLSGGDVIELIGDVGSGKTTLVKGIAEGLGIDEDVQSPSFTINRLYQIRDNLMFAHYDFYSLSDPGILKQELDESLRDQKTITAIEWAAVVSGILPSDRLRLTLVPFAEDTRRITIEATGPRAKKIEGKL
jgi:tRNA threonylcarbamoyladenosine biosynthesis protein TsaE